MPMEQEMNTSEVDRVLLTYKKRFGLANESQRIQSSLQQHGKGTVL